MKNKFYLFTLLLLFFINIFNTPISVQANSETIESNTPLYSYEDMGNLYEFFGTIKPTSDFYENEYINMNEDFIIDGYIKTTFSNGFTSTTKDIKAIEFESNYSSSKFVFYLFFNTEYQFNVNGNIRIIDINIKMPINLPINIYKFNSKLYSNVNNYTTIKTKSKNTNEIDIKFFNSLNQNITGHLIFENKSLTYGKNTVKYTFNPFQTQLFNYDVINGSFYVEVQLIVNAEKIYRNKIVLENISGVEYRVGEHGKWQNSRVLIGLKPNTNYTIYARVKGLKYNKLTSIKFNVKTSK